MRRSKVKKKVEWEKAPDIHERILHLVKSLELTWVDTSRIFSFRSQNSSARAYARIWGLSKVFQMALETPPGYVIEVISEKFDPLPTHKQDEVLIHELVHIPKTFSGSLLPHTRRRRGRPGFHDKVYDLVNMFRK